MLRPTDSDDLHEIVADAAASRRPIEVRCGGSKCAIGNPVRVTQMVDLGALRGIVDYEPSELVMTLRPATPLAEVEALLDRNGQMLAFEPWDHGMLRGEPGRATIGGVIAAGVAGSRRVSAGGARDHLLGFAAVSGRGEAFKAGGKVVKNVTGYDVSKLIAGSWGQLAVMTEISLKVLPRPRAHASLVITGLEPELAIAAMARALGSPASPVAAAHCPWAGNAPATVIRIEGIAESVAARADSLRLALQPFGLCEMMDDTMAADFWAGTTTGLRLATAECLWRIHIAPSRAAALAGDIKRLGGSWMMDWGGALVWAGAPGGCDIRAAATRYDGHASLVQAPDHVRAAFPARHPEGPVVAALSARVRQAFDPAGILDPHRFD